MILIFRRNIVIDVFSLLWYNISYIDMRCIRMEQFKEKNKPIFIQNKDFRTITISLFYPFEIKEEEIGLVDLLPAMLVHVSQKYPTEKEFMKEFMKRYIDVISVNIISVGARGFYRVILSIPDPIYLKEDHIEEAFIFLLDSIYHPLLQDNAFDEACFEKEKTRLLKEIDDGMKNIGCYSHQKFIEAFDEVGYLKESVYNHRKQVEKITSRDLYRFYQEKLGTQKPLSFVFGNTDEKVMTELFDKYLYHGNYETISFSKNYHFYQEVEKEKCIEEEGPFNQSRVILGYKIRDMKEEDYACLYMIEDLLSSQSSNLLSKELREKEEIVYTTYASGYSHTGALILSANIHRNNKEKAILGMKRVLEKLKDKEKIEPLMENIKERVYLSTLREKDSKVSLFNDFIREYFGYGYSRQTEYEKMNKVTSEDVCHMIERLQLDTTYYLEGVKDGK